MNLLKIENKKKLYYFGITAIFIILVLRFFYLQIYKQSLYFQESEKNRIREVILQPPRGLILDRNNIVMVDNYPSYSVYAIPFEVKKADSVLVLTGKILNLDVPEIKTRIRKHQRGLFTPVKIKRQIDFGTLSNIEENRLDLPGILYEPEPRRSYPSGVRAPHLFGYLGEIDRNELEIYKEKDYRLGDIIGKKGLEKVYDSQLQGLRGYRYIEVDALGREIRTLKDKPEILPLPGKNIILTIDVHLQQFLETRMDTLRGGAIVVNCRNGEVLALVSKPDYDPEIFTKQIPPDVWNKLITDPNKPLYDRMVQSLYPPGSTFKLVLAAAALETKTITPEFSVHCPGFMQFGRRTFDCWRREGHGEVDLYDAIEQSCNVYFYKLGLKVGLDNWSSFSRKFNFGKATNIDLIAEKSGLVPDRSYLDSTYGEGKWTKGLLLNLAVGQGDLLTTPLQLVTMAMIYANKGTYYKLHLTRCIEDPIDGSRNWTLTDSAKVDGISDTTFTIIREGMYRVVNGLKGTARICRFSNIKVAGKTGTAENPHGEPHAWFIGFAPFEKPQIAFCVLVENGGGGGAVAAPIARGIVLNYFKRHKQNLRLAHDIR